jgi:hypothetical protein
MKAISTAIVSAAVLLVTLIAAVALVAGTVDAVRSLLG